MADPGPIGASTIGYSSPKASVSAVRIAILTSPLVPLVA